jgi:hypothetical protein
MAEELTEEQRAALAKQAAEDQWAREDRREMIRGECDFPGRHRQPLNRHYDMERR